MMYDQSSRRGFSEAFIWADPVPDLEAVKHPADTSVFGDLAGEIQPALFHYCSV
jgi:hypothetical protein